MFSLGNYPVGYALQSTSVAMQNAHVFGAVRFAFASERYFDASAKVWVR